ncbi:hypothetical protein F4V48_09215 [Lactococcus lactis subsp. hordniae]|nr:hypothetical protein F4V48_09215 [Lactococcus lactis subsp. hordniae]MCT3135393.1 hypothetical protein [Lactococcus lactis]PCS09466.1 hypothetical protein RU90_GL001961 [Lactococcus lactis subsp. hordniae]
MRLASESKLLLEKLREAFKEQFGFDVSYSSLVNQIVRTQYKKMREIEWQNIKLKKLDFSNLTMSNDWGYQTSFMIEKDVLDSLLEMQIYFMNVFGAKRIHKAFVVRLCIKSYYLDNFK